MQLDFRINDVKLARVDLEEGHVDIIGSSVSDLIYTLLVESKIDSEEILENIEYSEILDYVKHVEEDREEND